jgi:hypothetical protein
MKVRRNIKKIMSFFIAVSSMMVKVTLHPLIHTFGSRKDTTTCGGGSEGARVWIKGCNPYFGNGLVRVQISHEYVLPKPSAIPD